LLALLLPAICAAQSAAPDAAADAAWRAQRLASVTSETGWLTPIALYWLKPGATSFGRAASNAFALDHPALAAKAGVFRLKDGQVWLDARRGSGLTVDGKAVRHLQMVADVHPQSTQLIAGTLHLQLIERAGHLGIRVRDSVSPERAGFRGLEYFSFRPDWVIDARFEPYMPPREVTIINILGMEVKMSSPGAAVFERDGHTWRLDALLEEPGDDKLFVMFSDQSSGRETYGAGRFLYAPLPAGGRIHLDFNRAYNPPCAFTEFATCPLPPPQNQLSLRVDAGELKYQRVHATNGH
jgi:uncharacterized protein (DUF1684 family)